MKPLSIFLAEDNDADVLLVREAFRVRRIDCELTVAEDGELGLAMIDGLGDDLPCPDIVLLDLNLPKADGVDLLRRLRANPHCAHVPVLIVTSSNSPKDRAVIHEFGAHYFHKPSELEEYLSLADAVMGILTLTKSPINSSPNG